jgi:predicted DNA-binding protein (UPF0251 family)
VADVPAVTIFKPVGVPMGQLHGVVLGLDGFEAMRLVDGEGMSQADAAARMQVSRPTLCRILGEARTQTARALSRGWAIRIDIDGEHTVTGVDFEETTPCCTRGKSCVKGIGQMQGELSCRDEQDKAAEEEDKAVVEEDRAGAARAFRAADAAESVQVAELESALRMGPDRGGCVATDPA